MSNGTSQELLLQLNDKLTGLSVSVGTIQSDIGQIKDSVGVLNHNSTSLDKRISNLEQSQMTSDAVTKRMDDMRASIGKRIAIASGIVGLLVVVLNLFGLLGIRI